MAPLRTKGTHVPLPADRRGRFHRGEACLLLCANIMSCLGRSMAERLERAEAEAQEDAAAGPGTGTRTDFGALFARMVKGLGDMQAAQAARAELKALGVLGSTIGTQVWKAEGAEMHDFADRLSSGVGEGVDELRAMRDDVERRFNRAEVPSREQLMLAHSVVGKLGEALGDFLGLAGDALPPGVAAGMTERMRDDIVRAQGAIMRHADRQVQ